MSAHSLYSVGVTGVVPIASFATYYGFERMHAWYKKDGLEWYFYIVSNLSLFIGALYLGWQTSTLIKFEWQKAIVVVGLVIPLVTAAFDWLSLGMSRRLLARLAEAAPKGAGQVAILLAWGVAAAIVLMIALAATLTLVLAAINALSRVGGGTGWVDLTALLKLAREAPGDSSLYWIYCLLATTFAPLALNVMAATTGLAAWSIPDATREKYQKVLKKPLADNVPRQREVACFLTRIQAIGVALAAVAVLTLATLLLLGVPWLGRVILWACEAAARLVGAV